MNLRLVYTLQSLNILQNLILFSHIKPNVQNFDFRFKKKKIKIHELTFLFIWKWHIVTFNFPTQKCSSNALRVKLYWCTIRVTGLHIFWLLFNTDWKGIFFVFISWGRRCSCFLVSCLFLCHHFFSFFALAFFSYALPFSLSLLFFLTGYCQCIIT